MAEQYEARRALVARAVTVFPNDTVVRALALMKRYGLDRLPVVDEARGELLGNVTAEDLRRVWEHSPLACMSEILSLKSLQAGEDGTSWRPRVTLVSPLVDVYQTSKRWKQ
ncbi:CBS domain-containing protein [Pyxidicoccus parkwayensis]|jgi:predicted transcriptional regulator|uniref:CBS domain-containing protein n=1 Tax=Pyxidicoccus parkwayensis TaxID=2813578 RepID=A0ABX7NPB5_9BACT|nr:CBS domain-containing protein [Pyxidicoccus parkwaysis]QSQ20697.1 CBS domain-containing protein [Pyxidicoccus parkwaysis]